MTCSAGHPLPAKSWIWGRRIQQILEIDGPDPKWYAGMIRLLAIALHSVNLARSLKLPRLGRVTVL